MTDLSVLTLVLVTLAAARITRLVTMDTIAAPARVRLMRFHAPAGRQVNPWMVALLECPWCVGFWVAVAALPFLAFVPEPVIQWLAAPWALSFLIGALNVWTNRD